MIGLQFYKYTFDFNEHLGLLVMGLQFYKYTFDFNEHTNILQTIILIHIFQPGLLGFILSTAITSLDKDGPFRLFRSWSSSRTPESSSEPLYDGVGEFLLAVAAAAAASTAFLRLFPLTKFGSLSAF